MFKKIIFYIIVMNNIFLEVPYKDKEEAKGLECKWDKTVKKWYVEPHNLGLECILEKWDIKCLDIPYDLRIEAKLKGCKWNKEFKKLYTYKSNKHFIDFPNTDLKLV